MIAVPIILPVYKSVSLTVGKFRFMWSLFSPPIWFFCPDHRQWMASHKKTMKVEGKEWRNVRKRRRGSQEKQGLPCYVTTQTERKIEWKEERSSSSSLFSQWYTINPQSKLSFKSFNLIHWGREWLESYSTFCPYTTEKEDRGESSVSSRIAVSLSFFFSLRYRCNSSIERESEAA